jgi:NitT/TauT family transport system permease protein
MTPQRYSSLKAVLAPATSIASVVITWILLTRVVHVTQRYLPDLGAVLADGWSIGPDLAAGAWRTLIETVVGFGLGSVLGVLVGVGFAASRGLERAVFPLFVALQSVPVIAFGAIVVIWFGNTILAKVVIALYLTFFPVAVNTLRGLQACNPQRIALMRSFGASPVQLFFKLTLPSAAPTIFVGLKLGISLSIAGAIVGEWFGDTVGLGVMLLQSLYFEQIPRLWMLILVCGSIGAVLYGLLALIERRFVWWQAD